MSESPSLTAKQLYRFTLKIRYDTVFVLSVVMALLSSIIVPPVCWVECADPETMISRKFKPLGEKQCLKTQDSWKKWCQRLEPSGGGYLGIPWPIPGVVQVPCQTAYCCTAQTATLTYPECSTHLRHSSWKKYVSNIDVHQMIGLGTSTECTGSTNLVGVVTSWLDRPVYVREGFTLRTSRKYATI